MSYGLHVRVIL